MPRFFATIEMVKGQRAAIVTLTDELEALPPVAKRLVREEGDLEAVLALQNICCEDHIRVAVEQTLLAQG